MGTANKFSMTEAAFDLSRGFDPAERPSVFIPVNQRSTRLSHEALVGVHTEARVGGEPLLHSGMLVGAVVCCRSAGISILTLRFQLLL
jgi:hypothetical protein